MHSHLNFCHHLLNRIVQAIQQSDSEKAVALLKDHQNVLSSMDEVNLNVRAGVLYHAIQCTALPLIALILHFAPSPDIQFYRLFGSTPLAMAIDKNAKDILPLLYPKSNKSFVLHAAVESHQKKVISALRAKYCFSPKLLQHLGLK